MKIIRGKENMSFGHMRFFSMISTRSSLVFAKCNRAKCPISRKQIKPLKSTCVFPCSLCRKNKKGKRLNARLCHSHRLREVFSFFFSFYGINWQLLRAHRSGSLLLARGVITERRRVAMRPKWFEITEYGVVVGMLIGTTMDFIGEFRYFQIDLHPSNDFRVIGVDWSSDFVVNSATIDVFFRIGFKDLIFNLIYRRLILCALFRKFEIMHRRHLVM